MCVYVYCEYFLLSWYYRFNLMAVLINHPLLVVTICSHVSLWSLSYSPSSYSEICSYFWSHFFILFTWLTLFLIYTFISMDPFLFLIHVFVIYAPQNCQNIGYMTPSSPCTPIRRQCTSLVHCFVLPNCYFMIWLPICLCPFSHKSCIIFGHWSHW